MNNFNYRLVQLYLILKIIHISVKICFLVSNLLNLTVTYRSDFIMLFQERWLSKFKTNNGSWVFVPTEHSIELGKVIKLKLDKSWKKPRYYYHLSSGGHVKALKKHLNNHFFLHLDIKNFFGCINKTRVTRNLKSFFDYKKSRKMAIESTVLLPESTSKKYILPFGFVQSPIIASLCLYNSKLGQYLDLIERKGVSVSVYMDDIIISSNNEIMLMKLLLILEKASVESNFRLNPNKTEGPARKITSFNIELSHLQLIINQERMDSFDKAYSKGNKYQKEGILSYVNSVNKDQVRELIST